MFDWDGTVADTLQIWIDVIQDNLNKLGLDLPMEAIILGLGDWNDMIPYGLPAEKLEAFAASARAQSEQAMPKAELYPAARETIARLKELGKKTAVITASHREIIEATLRKHDMLETFDVVITGSEVSKHKPDPEGLLKAMEALGVKDTSKVVMTGDSNRDMSAAVNANVDRALFHPPSHELLYDTDHLKTFEPTFVFSNWHEFVEALQ